MPDRDSRPGPACAAHGHPICPVCTTATEGELAALRDRHQRLVSDQAAWERDVRTAACRAAVDGAHAFGDMWARWRCDQALTFVTALCYRVQQHVPDGGGRITPAVAAQLRLQARDVEGQLRTQQPPVTFSTEAARAEVIRLRDLIVTEAQKLHAASGRTPLPCRCAGCELIRSMDDVTVPGAPPSTPLAHAASGGPLAGQAPARPQPGTRAG